MNVWDKSYKYYLSKTIYSRASSTMKIGKSQLSVWEPEWVGIWHNKNFRGCSHLYWHLKKYLHYWPSNQNHDSIVWDRPKLINEVHCIKVVSEGIFILVPQKVPNHFPEQKILISCLLLRVGNSNFLLRWMIWHLLLVMGPKSKYLLISSHL